jgi:phosphatidylglycerol lysyltransferase
VTAQAPGTAAEDPADDRARLLPLLRRHGWNATSFQTLEQGFRYWFDGDRACVPYVEAGRAWVTAGAPIAPARRLVPVAQRFAAAAARQGRRVVFFATERRFSRGQRFRAQLIGEQPVWDPAAWPQTSAAASIQSQLRRARNKGVTVRRVTTAELRDRDQPVRRAIEGLVADWLAARPMAPMGFLVDVQPFALPDERRCFVAERAGAVVGFLAAVPVYARRGWLFEDLVRAPAAPNGTAELLVDTAMRAVAAEGSRYVTLGLAPLAPGGTGWMSAARLFAGSLYDFRGVRGFRTKLRPHRWDPIYLHTPPSRLPGALAGTIAIFDALRAFARGGLLRFGLETLLRGPAFVVRLLAALLVPWTILLALASSRWFPSPAIKWTWVTFDALLAGALFVLAARWRRWLGITLATAVSADVLATAAQVVLHDVPGAAGPATTVVLALAITAPTVAAIVLWKAIDHRHGRRHR